jgi:chromosome segregation ATPase
MKLRESEFCKTKAVLEQKIELMELQMIETKESTESQKKMYDSMLKALQSKSENSTYEKHLEEIRKTQSRQDGEAGEIRKKYESQLTDLKQKLNLADFNEKSLKSQLKQQKNDLKQELREKESKIRDLQLKIQSMGADHDKTVTMLQDQIERMEEKHRNDLLDMNGNKSDDLQNLKEEYESKLSDIKYLNEQEVLSLKSQIRKLEEEISLLRENEDLFETSRDSEFGSEKVKVLDIRLSEINDKFSDNMLKSEKEIAKLRRENEEANTKIESLKVQIEKLKTTMTSRLEEKDEKYGKLKEKYNEKCEEVQKAEGKGKDLLRYKKRISDLKIKISKLEGIKRDLKEALKERENELDIERIEKKRALIAERKKAKLKGDQLNKMKREVDMKSIEIESLKRDNFDMSERDDSRYYSPRGMGKKMRSDDEILTTEKKTMYSTRAFRLDSPSYSGLNTTNLNDSSSNIHSTKRLKSSSPNRSKLMASTQKIRVGGLGRDRSARRMIQISSERVNMYDDTHRH